MKCKHTLITFVFLFQLFTGYGQEKLKTLLFIGSYTNGKPDTGIYVYEFNTNSGELKKLSEFNNIVNPSYITVSRNGKYLYACTETKLLQPGNVSSFSIDSLNGQLTFLNKRNAEGENPVYLSVHPKQKFIANGNYTGGSVSIFPINEYGSLDSCCQFIQFRDSSINIKRQEKSHIHSAVFSPDGNYLFLPDLGADKIRVYNFNCNNLTPISITNDLTIKTRLGGGPRHFIFHPNNKTAYCIEELSGTIVVYNYLNGKLDSVQSILSYSKKQESYGSADIHLSPDGLFLYASNRWDNENTISIFEVNQKTGQLSVAGHQTTFGQHPRSFTIDPSGKYLLVANMVTNNIVVFERDFTSGLLTKTKNEIQVKSPSCLKMKSYMK